MFSPALQEEAGHHQQQLVGYAAVQATRPQTIGYSLADSPVGLAAWVYAMFQDVGGTVQGDAEAVLTLDQMLDDITPYWLTSTRPRPAGTSPSWSSRPCWWRRSGRPPAGCAEETGQDGLSAGAERRGPVELAEDGGAA